MAYSVDAQIREQNRLLTAGQEGDDSGQDFLHSYEGQRISMAIPEFAHTREVISKFGGTIRQGTPVAIPPQKWNEVRNPVARNPFDSPVSYRSRQTPSHVIVAAGVSGYGGHVPNAAQWGMPHRRADRHSPFLQPYLEAQGESLERYPAVKPHVPDHAALVTGKAQLAATKRVPTVGYTGHIRGKTGDATKVFGTSHWRSEPPISRADAALAAYRDAKEKGQLALGAGFDDDDDDMFEC